MSPLNKPVVAAGYFPDLALLTRGTDLPLYEYDYH